MIVNTGDVLAGKYRVDRVLGIGGMGMVVSATHLELDQRVALKFMLPEALASAQATDRFLREARAAVKLRGEHVCRVLDVGKLDNGSPYIVMEFLEGEDFAQLLGKRGALHVTEAVDYILQSLEGLAEAHVNSIVHRDLKPGNLFVATDNDGSPLVKVLDFGISKSAGANATKTGEIMGSPAYMAPEQMMSAKDVDARADIYAMGVILYHAVGGRVPFESDNIGGLCMKVLNEAPVPLEQIAPVPQPFAAIVMRCLSKQREGRFNDVGELAVALAPFGSADAAGSAMRITKVLRRTAGASGSSAAIAMTLPSSSAGFQISHPTPTPAPGSSSVAPASMPPSPRQPISTIGAGSGESMRVPSPLPAQKSKWPVFAAIGAVAVVAIVAVAMTRGGSNTEPTQATQPGASDPKDHVTEPPKPPPKDPPPEPKPVVDQTPTEVKPTTPEVKPAVPEVKLAMPEVKPTKPTIATKPATKPITKPVAGSATKPLAAGSGSAAVTKPPVATPTSGSASPGPGSGYKGTKGKIITEYPTD
ncbi:MAG: protein kinase [Deltaproteobacteria bacterium]|nr:protein kinase [Deltaproteobacteria bacterium]